MIELVGGALRALVSETGAELCALDGADGTEYLWRGDPALWARHAPVLFPHVGRLPGGRYTWRGETYSLPLHGFAGERVFTVEARTPASVALTLRDDAATRAQYPFAFLLRVEYALAGDMLRACFTVKNQGDGPMPFGLGAHPGFRVPLREGLALDDYALRFGAPCRPLQHLLGDDCLMSGETAPFSLREGAVLRLSSDLFDRDALVLSEMARSVTLFTAYDWRTVEVTFPDAPYLALWQPPHTGAPFLCIEPWLSLPAPGGAEAEWSALPTLVQLSPGERRRFRWSVAVGRRARRRCGGIDGAGMP